MNKLHEFLAGAVSLLSVLLLHTDIFLLLFYGGMIVAAAAFISWLVHC